MKSIFDTIDDFKKAAEGGGSSDFLKLKDKESVRVRFLQELDNSGSNFDESKGTALGVFEHANPESGTPKFACTADELGKCFGCELAVKTKGWKKRARLYINASLRGTGGEPSKVVIINQGLSNRSIGGPLIEYFGDLGTICDRDYKIKRNGEGLKTTYALMPLEPSKLSKEDKEAQTVDLSNFVKKLSYEEQVEAVESGVSSKDGDDW